MMKRHAHVAGDTIVITCVPDEMKSHHLEPLRKVVAEINAAYRAFDHQHKMEEEEQRKRDEADSAALRDLNKLFRG